MHHHTRLRSRHRTRLRYEILEDRRLLAASAEVSLPLEIRERQVVPLAIASVSDLDVSQVDRLQIDWGDGQTSIVPSSEIQFPLTRLHHYGEVNSAVSVNTSAVLLSGATVTLSTDPVSVVANSPPVVDRVSDGLAAEIFTNLSPTFDFSDPPSLERIDPTIAFDFGAAGPDPRLSSGTDPFAIRWTGTYLSAESGDHGFFASTGVGDEIRLSIDGVVIIDTFGSPTTTEQNAFVNLVAEQPITLSVEYVAASGASSVEVGVEHATSFKTTLPSDRLAPVTSSVTLRSGVLTETFLLDGTNGIAQLRDSAGFVDNAPTDGFDSADFAFVANEVGGVATRNRALLTAPVSGEYVFHLAASDEAQLWLSSSEQSDNSQLIALVSSSTTQLGFQDPGAGESALVYLVAGEDYYIETLHVHDQAETLGHVAVGWTRPEVPTDPPVLVNGSVLRPITPVVTLSTDISQTFETERLAQGNRVVVSRTDDFGRDLEVAYTLGGEAENGTDFQSLSGIVTIPKGATSVTIDIDPIDDGQVELSEEFVLRLVADTRYQLGDEHERQSTLTIAGELIDGVDVVPQDFNTFLGEAFFLGAGENAFTPLRETDDSLPFADGTTGNNFLRVEVSSFVNVYDVLVGRSINSADLPDGEQVFVSFWARSAVPETNAKLAVRLQEGGAPFAGVQLIEEVNDQWTPIVWPVVTDFDGSTQDRTFDIRLGFQNQIVDLAGFSLQTFQTAPDPATLPARFHTFVGREADAAWRSDSSERVFSNRRHPVDITILDAAGNPVDQSRVAITPVSTALPIATTVTPERVVPSSDPFTQLPKSLRYQAILATHFDALTDGGTAHWGPWLENSQRPTDFATWVVDQDLPYHGHAIIWGEIEDFPAPAFLKSGYDAVVASDGLAAGELWLESEILNHVATGPAAAFSSVRSPLDDTPIVTWWDAVNHPIFSREIWDIVGNDFIIEFLDAVRGTSTTAGVVHSDTKLVINEASVLGEFGPRYNDGLFSLLTDLDDNSVTGRASYDTIGFQGHFLSRRLPAISSVVDELERFSVFDRDFQVTEYDVDTQWIDEQTQLDFTRDFFRVLAADGNVSLATIWGFWEQEHWRSSEGAQWFHDDWTPRPVGQWYLDQRVAAYATTTVTTDEGGRFQLNLDASEVQIHVEGIAESIRVVLSGQPMVVQVPLPNVAPVFTNDGGGEFALVNVDENQSFVTTLATTDANPDDAVAYSIESGVDAGLFDLDAFTGELIFQIAPDFESNAGPFFVNVQAIDRAGEIDSQSISVTINDVVDRLFVVDTINDTPDASPGDGVAIDAAGQTSLRAAIEEANAVSNDLVGTEEIRFDIPGALAHTILLGSLLPAISESIIIDATSQSGYLGAPLIEITNGASLSVGLRLLGGNSAIRGLAITGFATGLIVENGSGSTIADNYLGLSHTGTAVANNVGLRVIDSQSNQVLSNVISGNNASGVVVSGTLATDNVFLSNLVGTDPTGQFAIGNDGFGVVLMSSGNVFGQPGQGNVVSGNESSGLALTRDADNSVVMGNFIGTDSDGETTLANANFGLFVATSNNQIGGNHLIDEGNVFSGNGRHGIAVVGATANENQIQGNFLGTNRDGDAAIANGSYGLLIVDAENNTVGGLASGEMNLVSGNRRSGIVLTRASSTTVYGNRIGTQLDGLSALPNQGIGILLISSFNNDVASNLVSGNSSVGLSVSGIASQNNRIQNNLIGVNAIQSAELDNGPFAILLKSPNNTVGGEVGQGNVIAGSLRGIVLSGVDANNNVIANNFVGTDDTVTFDWGLATGVQVSKSAADNMIGPGNSIVGNETGIRLSGSSGNGNAITENQISQSSLIGIDIASLGLTPNDMGDADESTNRGINFPVIETVVLVDGQLEITVAIDTPTTTAAYDLTLEFFLADNFGQGAEFLIAQTFSITDEANAVSVFVVPVSGIVDGDTLTATATDSAGNTSEFSPSITVSGSLPTAAAASVIPTAMTQSPLDISADGMITPLDALIVINGLTNLRVSGEEFSSGISRSQLDANRDGVLSPLDVLVVINWLSQADRLQNREIDFLSSAMVDEVMEGDEAMEVYDLLEPSLF